MGQGLRAIEKRNRESRSLPCWGQESALKQVANESKLAVRPLAACGVPLDGREDRRRIAISIRKLQ